MKVRLYGRLADVIGREVTLGPSEGARVGEVRRLLQADYPQAAECLGRSRACVGDLLVDDHQWISPGEPLEFLPPVSGG